MSENGHNLWLGTIRQATAADGPAIGNLYREAQWADHGVDWTRSGIADWWIVAEANGEIVGAVQICLSQPFGYIGDIVVHPQYRSRNPDGTGRLSKRLGALAYTLYLTAYAMLQRHGTEIVMGIIPQEQTGLLRFFQRTGATPLGDFVLYGRRTT